MIWNDRDIESFDGVSMMKMMSTYEDQKAAIDVYVDEDLKGLPIQFWLPKCYSSNLNIGYSLDSKYFFYYYCIWDYIFYRYLFYHSIRAYFIDRFMNGKHLSKNYLLVISGLLECPSIKKKTPMVLQTENVYKKKFNCWNIPIKLFLRWLAVVFRIILFQPFVKYWRNNYVGDVTVEVVYAIILFKLSGIYRRMESIGNTVRDN